MNNLTPQRIIPPYKGSYHLDNYKDTYQNFSWDNVSDDLSFRKTNKVNLAYESVDRHVEQGRENKTAVHYIDGNVEVKLTYKELKEKTDSWAAVLKDYGIQKGDRVFVLLPKHPDCYIAILSIIKIGAIAGPLFEGFMTEAIRDRVEDCGAKAMITNEDFVGRIPTDGLPELEFTFVTDQEEDKNGAFISLKNAPQIKHEVIEWGSLDDGVIIHYTSGSTGKPKGILHAHAIMIQLFHTGRWVLDLHEDDIYWCTSHPGWVTGSLYGIFSPLLNGVTVVVNGGRFQSEQWIRVIEQAGVTVWYSAPTAFRLLMTAESDLYGRFNLTSLRHVLSVGEPLNPDIISWGLYTFGKRIHDTWWMTETGGQLVANLPSQPIKPGSMGRPLPGIDAAILDEEGVKVKNGVIGQLAIKATWPSIMKEVWRQPDKYASYFKYKGWYLSGDLAYQDDEGYIFYQGRDDDMINSSGERIGPFEVESQLIQHPAVREAAVIGKPDPIRGQIVKAFIVLNEGYQTSPQLIDEIRLFVKKYLAAHVAPKEIKVIDALPKTAISGKIMRRLLRDQELTPGIETGA